MYLKVKNEFEVSLTVYGEDPKIGTEAEQVKKYPWIVLSIDLFISSSGACRKPLPHYTVPRPQFAHRVCLLCSGSEGGHGHPVPSSVHEHFEGQAATADGARRPPP